MTAIVLTILFILQLGSFYVIALLYMRLSKLDGAEKKQQQLMSEMEASLALYIAEVKEENDRLIEQLTHRGRGTQSKADHGKDLPAEAVSHTVTGKQDAPAAVSAVRPPALKVMDSYRAQQAVRTEEPGKPERTGEQPERKEETGFETVYRLHAEGLTAAEIASRLGKGKTEIELILKFNQ